MLNQSINKIDLFCYMTFTPHLSANVVYGLFALNVLKIVRVKPMQINWQNK